MPQPSVHQTRQDTLPRDSRPVPGIHPDRLRMMGGAAPSSAQSRPSFHQQATQPTAELPANFTQSNGDAPEGDTGGW